MAALNIKFFSADRKIPLKNREKLKKHIQQIFKNEKRPLESLNFIFCSDAYLLKINSRYLHKKNYTDIITFDLSEGEATKGEVYISLDRVRDNAQAYRVSFSSELHRVIFHGALHLCGYDDSNSTEKQQMTNRENFYLGKYLS